VSIVRENLILIKGYTPYCGNKSLCSWPRTFFNGEQFVCKECGWRSRFDKEFISEYKERWGL